MPKSILNKPLLLIIAATFSISSIFYGCATPAEVKDAPVLSPKEIPSGQKAKPVQLKKVMVKIKRGTVIGSWQDGIFCLPGGEITWKGGRYFLDIAEFDGVFREEFERANYTVVGDPDALFDDPSSWQAEFLIGAIITDIEMSVCNWGTNVKGEIYLKVDWQVYSRLDRKVVYKTTTEGSYENTEFTDETLEDLVLNVFGMATQNLLADQKFYALVAGETIVAAPSPESFGKLILAKSTPFNLQIETTINDVRMGVVTVFAGEGHGSGFFIDSEGHMLTSAHVVKGAKFIKIRLVTGREILGEVLRRNPRMDIALVKAGEKNMVPLPVNEKELNIGAPVCAIGSPLDKSFSSTFTKGVLSAYRTTEGMTFIQSDVNVLPGQSGCPLVDQKGNAVGICVTGVLLGGAPAGLNFFVPINHALNALNIEMVAPAEVESKRLLAAREIKTTPEKPKTEAVKPALEKETPKVAAIPKEVSITRVSLRKKPKAILNVVEITNILVEHDFFDISRNVLGSFENHFIDNKDGTITDKATGLMWQKSGSSNLLDNRDAKEYIKRLNRKRFAGHKNWRMPTVEELASLINKDKIEGVHTAQVFDNKKIKCWTVDPCEPNYSFLSGAWIVDFKQGKVSIAMWSYDVMLAMHNINKMNYVKAVRSVR